MNWFFLAAALALLLWFFALLYLKSIIQRKAGADHILGLLQEEVRQLEAVIDEKTEQNLQLLEDKINALREICDEAEKRIVEAEKRIAMYGRELEKREKETQVLAALDPGGAAVQSTAAVHGPLPPEKKRAGAKPVRENTPQPEKQERKKAREEGSFPRPGTSVPLLASLELRDYALDVADSAYRAQAGRPPASAPKIIVSGEPLVSKQPPVNERIAEFYRAGFAPELIAERLGLPLGEVTVYINMCKLQGKDNV